ncbi:unnamed protein product [Rotaria sp. Silwood1]|nr:unnamed protein product [Rotaria sp. Silwood1]CAF4778531.1 unnamed protein product [Rotaria sp. Silwood1]CAF4805888.1 unnamed protein product [Rotaria sp. Silwood1]CAF4823621.1 unnamed protein product [Rotaria sp. Silwood1]
MYPAASFSASTCAWCSQQTSRDGLKKFCTHRVCKQCIIIDKLCQSDCPMCWYINGAQFIHDNKICSGPVLSQGHKTKSSTKEEIGDCMICLEQLGSSYHKLEVCGHVFHKVCIDQWFQSNGKQSCPSCGYVYGISPQPPNGRMIVKYINKPLPGFENENYGSDQPTIEIVYTFKAGLQGPLNPNPGKPYSGTTRNAYLPNNEEGKEVLRLLRKAFDDQHIFTIGRSTTSGQDNVITWNDIHHKTSIHGGPERFAYPDPTYLFRVRQELADKGYK